MGEWSEYFEDFPEENQANYLNGQFNPLKEPKPTETLNRGFEAISKNLMLK